MVPLVFIVGFLGAGKTSLMRELVPRLVKEGLRPHVVLNDFQNAKVDATYFEGLAAAVAPISGTCVCCDSFEELVETLESQQLDEKSILLLEANGTTDSVELIEQLSLRPECARYTMPIQISLVDTKRWQKRHWHNDLEREQMASANFLQLTWQDTVTEERFQQVRAQLSELAPGAEVVDTQELVQALVTTQDESAPWPPRRLTARESGHGEHHHHEHEHDHHHEHDHSHHEHEHSHDHHHHEHGHDHGKYHFASWEHPLPAQVDPQAFYQQLNDLPPEVLRCKGIVRLAKQNGERLIFQKVGSDDLLATPLPDTNGIEPMIIFVGASLPIDELRSRIEHLEAATTS